MHKYSLDKSKIKVLLLEGIHENAVHCFQNAGYSNLTWIKTALPEEELREKIRTFILLAFEAAPS
jgi:D-3-phosphoglycerate dehydrogenase